MDAKSDRNMYSNFAVANKHTARLHQVGFLYIYRYWTSNGHFAQCFVYNLANELRRFLL